LRAVTVFWRNSARHQTEQPAPVIHYRRPKDKRSRAQRWRHAVAELLALQAEYAAWHETLPETFGNTATAEALQAIVELDSPPRGYRRD
jgi:hypothetical protein